MKRKAISGIMLTLLLISILTLAFNIQPVKASETIYIRADGSIDPPTAPIQQDSDFITQSSVDWWPMFQHDERNTGYSTSTGPNKTHVKWIFNAGALISKPSVADGIAYVCFGSWYPTDWGIIVALNVSNGYQIWNYSTGYYTDSIPAIADGVVYLGCYRTLYAFNATNGDIVWTKPMYIDGSPPTVTDGVVYAAHQVGSNSARLYALNATNGNTIWYSDTLGLISSAPAVAEGFVYVAYQSDAGDQLYALNATTGVGIWSYPVRAQGCSAVAVGNGIVYFSSFDEKVYALNATNGNYIWDFTTGMPTILYQTPSVAYGIVYAGTSGGYGGPGKLYALNASNGSLKWGISRVECAFSNVAVANGVVYVGKDDVYGHGIDEVYALNAFTGGIIWSYSGITGHPVVADGALYVSYGGKLYALGPSNDVAVTNVIPNKTTVIRGLDDPKVMIEVTAENQGSYTETFNVTAYVNATQIGEKTVSSLNPGTNRLLSFTWDTTGFDIGNYTISAVADTVTNETDTLDNTYIDGTVTVRLPVHDVAVVDISPASNIVVEGFELNITVTVENPGDFSETFNVTAYANTTTIEEQEVSLNSGESANLIFTWNTTGFSPSNYTISANATAIPEETNMANNNYIDGIVAVRLPIYDIAVLDVTTSKSDCLPMPTVGQGYSVNVKVTVANQGDFPEFINVTLYVNTTAVANFTSRTLLAGASVTIPFIWNTTGFAKGNYTIKAVADIVPGETNTEDNTYTDGLVLVSVPGDINGDFKVDVKDLVLVIKYFGSYPGSVKPWNPNGDINSDGKVDIKDLVLVIKHFGEHYP